MCYNCGCGMPDDDMGVGHAASDPNGKAITSRTFEEVAKAQGMSVEEAKKYTLEMLQKEVGKSKT